MTDIVERLRENRPKMPTRDRYEAADTIEALRAENARLLKSVKGAYYEGYRDRHMFGDTDDPDDRNLWALSHTRAAMGESDND